MKKRRTNTKKQPDTATKRKVIAVIIPGFVRSASDYDVHFIDVGMLANLVGLRAGEYMVDRNDHPGMSKYYERDDLIVVRPKLNRNGYDRVRLLVERKRLENA